MLERGRRSEYELDGGNCTIPSPVHVQELSTRMRENMCLCVGKSGHLDSRTKIKKEERSKNSFQELFFSNECKNLSDLFQL